MKLIPASVSRSVAKTVLKSKKNSPHIFFAAGIVGVVGGTILACRATLKLEETVDEIKNDLVSVKHKHVSSDGMTLTEGDYRRDLVHTYSKSTVKIVRLYGPSVVVGGLSIAALAGSHIQLTRRNAALTATLVAVTQAFEEYRERVRNEVGEERELEIHRAINKEKIDGKLVKVTDSSKISPYARMFDEGCYAFRKNAEMNRVFLKAQQNYANERLSSRGHVYLNEVYDSLGIEHSKEGAIVGWIRHGDGDGYIDFGIEEVLDRCFYGELDVNEPRMLLDFNVDGVIWDKI